MPNEYIARVSDKKGKVLHKTGVHPSREEAAKAAYEARPNARSVSTSIAHNGQEAHRDIRWHNKADIMKDKNIEEGEIVSCQLRTKGRKNMRRSKTVREGIAYLIEDVMEKSEVVLAAQSIADKLQDIAEDLSTLEAKEIMPLSDSLTNAFGQQVANQFSSVATEQVRQLITTIQGSKSAIDQEIQRMKQGVEGGDMSDMAMDNSTPSGAPGGDMAAQGSVPPATGLPDAPTDQQEPPEDAGGIGGGFAGRARKEGAKVRGKQLAENDIKEDFLSGNEPAGRSPPAIAQHPHKSANFAANINNLNAFHGQAGKLARNIESMIDSGSLSGDERTALSNVLSHFAAFAEEPAHWSDAESKLKMALKSAGLWDTSKPEVDKVVGELRKLAHLISFKHAGILENAIKELKTSSDPDAVILQVFRSKLSESKDAQTAAIHAARTFAIDIEDVVSIVREAAENRDRYGETAMVEAAKKEHNEEGRGKFKVNHTSPDGKTRSNDRFETKEEASKFAKDLRKKGYKEVELTEGNLSEFKLNTPASAKGMFKGKTTGDLEKRATRDKAAIASANDKGKGHAAATKDLRRADFAVRAHKSKNGGGWHHEVNEDEMIKNGTMFPVQAGPNAMGTPNPPISNPGPSSQSTPPVGGPNSNPSTNKSMTPGDLRANQQAQASGNQVAPQQAPASGQPMTPPSESEQNAPVPPSTQPRMAPTNQVTQQQQKRNQFRFQRQQ